MKLAHYDFESIFELSPGVVNVLVVEPENYFFKYCNELLSQTEGGEGNFVLSENDEILDISKCSAFTESYLSFQNNDKKVSSKLYYALRDIAETKFLQDYRNICVQISSFISKLNAESDCPISYEEELDIISLFKTLGINVENGDTLLERLLMYLHVKSCFFGVRCFFFVNLKTFLTAKELEMFYYEAELMEICIFLLENTCKPKLACEHVVIIDSDLCEILA